MHGNQGHQCPVPPTEMRQTMQGLPLQALQDFSQKSQGLPTPGFPGLQNQPALPTTGRGFGTAHGSPPQHLPLEVRPLKGTDSDFPTQPGILAPPSACPTGVQGVALPDGYPLPQPAWKEESLPQHASQPPKPEAASTQVKPPVIQPPTPDKPFYNSEGVDLMKLSDEELEKYVPLDESGRRTSIGAINHPTECSPCIFWFRHVCEKGFRCEFCHIKHPGQVAKKIRPSKSFRMKQKEQEQAGQSVADSRHDLDKVG